MNEDAPVEVLVVGAGPAGVAAAVTARRLGLDVLLLDKARFPRDKSCGDGLTTGALRRLEALGLDVRKLPSYARAREAVVVSPSGRQVVLPLPPDGEFAGAVPRVELDAALVSRARAEGVAVHEGCEVSSVRAGDDHLDVGVDGTAVRARWVVAADGHYSAVRRMVGIPGNGANGTEPDLGTWHAFRQYFRGVRDDRMWVVFDEDLLPGYAWVFPLGGGRANVGFGVLRASSRRARPPSGSGRRLAATWRSLLDRPHVRAVLGPDAEPEAPLRAWPIPASFDPGRLAHGRVLFVGDAAAAVDPMTGEGVAQALLTGELASRAIAAYETPDAVTARYVRDVRRELGVDLRFARLLQHVLRAPIGARAAVRIAGSTAWTRRNFARWMFEDYPRAVILTPRRWRRGMFAGAGAYSGDRRP